MFVEPGVTSIRQKTSARDYAWCQIPHKHLRKSASDRNLMLTSSNPLLKADLLNIAEDDSQ